MWLRSDASKTPDCRRFGFWRNGVGEKMYFQLTHKKEPGMAKVQTRWIRSDSAVRTNHYCSEILPSKGVNSAPEDIHYFRPIPYPLPQAPFLLYAV
jgi:hypothetical protein